MRTDSLARQIEKASLDAWPALQQIQHGEWVLRFSEGYTKRANSVNSLCEVAPREGIQRPAGAGGIEASVRFVEHCYRDRGMPAIFRITPFTVPQGLDRFLEQRGYVQLDPTQVSLLGLDGFEPASIADGRSMGLCSEPRQEKLDTWLALFARLHAASGVQEPLEKQQAHRAILQSIAGKVQPYLLEAQGTSVACALGVLDGKRLGLFDLYVDPAFRRQGYGTAMMVGILSQAKQQGVRWVYLQVTEANKPARKMYRKLGFGNLYCYWYRVREE
jgi:ribosomal protein S18 acetylase RimI-like enzyme